jgi:hypothetical protein
MEYLGDVSQVRAFLGCCQQIDVAVHQDYGIIAAPLHALTKKTVVFPKPWKENEVYSKSFRELKAAILDSENFLHHKDPSMRLFLEVDASGSSDWMGSLCISAGREVGWGPTCRR